MLMGGGGNQLGKPSFHLECLKLKFELHPAKKLNVLNNIGSLFLSWSDLQINTQLLLYICVNAINVVSLYPDVC